MSLYRESIKRALAAVSIVSPTSFTWFGAVVGELPDQVAEAIDAASARAYLVHQLQSVLYSDFYCSGNARPLLADPRPSPTFGPSSFIHALSAANRSTVGRERGWTVVAKDGDRLVVERGGLRIWAHPREVYGPTVAPGSTVGVMMPKELLRLSPGFYMALGEAEFPTNGATPIVRFYWNLRADAAPELIRMLTDGFNARGLAFRVKVASDPEGYTRCDSGVLYTVRSEFEDVVDVVASVHNLIPDALLPATPALTKRLAPGIGLAEDPPGTGSSFGTTRCLLLAEAITSASELGLRTLPTQLDAVAEAFKRAGLNLDVPYLNPGSQDTYAWPN